MHRGLIILAVLLPIQVMALQDGGFTYDVTSSNTVEITRDTGNGGDLVIPTHLFSQRMRRLHQGSPSITDAENLDF
jgi:hypothetical protein